MSVQRMLGRMLATSGRGFWISGRNPDPAIYLFLFGRAGEVVARGLPPHSFLKTRVEAAPEPRLLVITDRHGTAEDARRSGHLSLCVDALSEFPSHRRVRWLMNLMKAQMASLWPRAVLWSPITPQMLEWAGRFSADLRELVSAGAALPTPTFLAPEMDLDYVTLRKFLDRTTTADSVRMPVNLLSFGDPDLFDYRQHLVAAPPVERVVCLGPYSAPESSRRLSPAGGAHIFLWVRDPGARRELAARLAGSSEVLQRFSGIVVFEDGEPAGSSVPSPPSVTFEPALWRFLDRADSSSGLVVADGDAETTLLETLRSRTVLVRSLSSSAAALLKCSYYLASQRIGVVGKQSELLELLEREGAGDPGSQVHGSAAGATRESWEGFAREVYDPVAKRR